MGACLSAPEAGDGPGAASGPARAANGYAAGAPAAGRASSASTNHASRGGSASNAKEAEQEADDNAACWGVLGPQELAAVQSTLKKVRGSANSPPSPEGRGPRGS